MADPVAPHPSWRAQRSHPAGGGTARAGSLRSARDDDPPPAVPIRFRGGGFLPRTSRLAAVAAFAIVLAVWQGASASGWLSPIFLPSPADIARALSDLTLSGELWRHLSVSLVRIGLGWLLLLSRRREK